MVGVCQIDLTTKIPWCPETYVAPQTDIFKKGDAARDTSDVSSACPSQSSLLYLSLLNYFQALVTLESSEMVADEFDIELAVIFIVLIFLNII